MKILYVEDSANDVSTVRRIAEYMGHMLSVAATGAEGHALMAANRPDMVLLDINLPDATVRQTTLDDGTQLIKWLAQPGKKG